MNLNEIKKLLQEVQERLEVLVQVPAIQFVEIVKAKADNRYSLYKYYKDNGYDADAEKMFSEYLAYDDVVRMLNDSESLKYNHNLYTKEEE